MFKFCDTAHGMKKILLTAIIALLSYELTAQSFEVSVLQDSYKGTIGEIIKVPLVVRNISTKPVTITIRKTGGVIGTSQKNYFCPDERCLDQRVEDYNVRIEPGQSLTSLQIALEAGLVPGLSNVKYVVFNRTSPTEALDLDLNFIVEERPESQTIYHSRHITLQDVYPNPASTHAFVDYRVISEHIKAKVVLHNVLGSAVGEYDLPLMEHKVKINTEDLNPGIYFYTLYIDNEGVMTRKLVIKK